MIENQQRMDSIIRGALEEDLETGDLTTDAIISPDLLGKAALETREDIVLAGLQVFIRTFELLSTDVEFEYFYEDSQSVRADQVICNVSGSMAAILKAERTALNFIQRMSGIATLTREYVIRAGSEKVRILDTRKTTPGLRLFEKYAVRMGGGFNHRFGLFDGILIKDNHIAAARSIAKAVKLAKKTAPEGIKVEVEIEKTADIEEAIGAGADIILLDNMSIDDIRAAVSISSGRVKMEASGGVNLENIGRIAGTGVDFISVGALTHSARAVDLSLGVVSG